MVKLTLDLQGLELDDSADILAWAQDGWNQIENGRRHWLKLKRAYDGKPVIGDVYPKVAVEARRDDGAWINGDTEYRIMHLIANQVVRDSQVQGINGPDDEATKEVIREFTRMQTNLRVWPPAIQTAEIYGQACVHGWTHPRTGLWHLWVESPLVMVGVEEDGLPVALVRIWTVDKSIYINVTTEKVLAKFVIGGVVTNGNRATGAVAGGTLRPRIEDDEEWPLPNPLGVLPGAIFKTDPVEPKSGMEAGLPLYTALVKNWARANRAADTSTPSYLMGVETGELPVVPGGPVPTVPKPGAVNNGQGGARQQRTVPYMEPGTVNRVRKYASLDAVGGASPEPLLKMVDVALEGICQVTSTALVDVKPSSQVSGASRREARRSYTDKLRARHGLYGAAIADLCQITAIHLGLTSASLLETGDPLAEDGRLEDWVITFEDPDKLTEMEEYELAAKMKSLGIPDEEIFLRLGWPKSKVDQWKKDAEARFKAAQQAAGPGKPLVTNTGTDPAANDGTGAGEDKLKAVA